MDLVGGSLIGAVEAVVRDDAHGGRIAVRDVLEPLGHQPHAVVQHKDPRRVRRAAGHVHQHRVAVEQRRRHAVALDMHDPQLGGTGLQAVADPGAAKMVGAVGRVLMLLDHGAAAHRRPRARMCDGNECLVRALDEGRRALDLADPVDQPVAVHLQHAGNAAEFLHAGACRTTAEDVVDEGAIHAGHLGDVGGADAELLGPGPEAIGKRVVLCHVFPKRLWIK